MMFTLPKPNGGFEWVQLAAGPALVCRPLEAHAAHFLTTRLWQLGSPSASVDQRWQEIAQAIDVGPTRLARVRQVHGAATVVRRGDNDASRPEADIADIIVSDASTWALAIQTADCLPLLVADRRTGAVAAAHAGWRGLALSVPVVTVESLGSEFGSRPADLIVAIGPAIGACCYEVGEDVRARFEEGAFGPAQMARWFMIDARASPGNPSMPSLPSRHRAHHWFFDLWQAARDQLEWAGVPADQIWVAGLCTASHAGAFCSYRRDGAAAERMAAIIRCRPRP
jgi:purine-nucleoside/S-methyl-5'-thioadenosine phosphorylase / adenosine deaminase